MTMDSFVGLIAVILLWTGIIRACRLLMSSGPGRRTERVFSGPGLGGCALAGPYRENANEKGPVHYEADSAYGRADRNYTFFYKKVSGSWRAYILRTPDPGSRDRSASVVHRLQDSTGYYICWDRSVATLRDMEAISHVWANSIQTYIHTGRRFG